ncbi:MAG TPA: DUF3037 domain-containing protein [Acidobacteriaceae bacterium]|nr:DUF3037 domain-containing protein [Acidobacteriaceae bacterium]
MPERIPCEFFLVRYVPDPVKCEFVNIGVVLREVPGEAATYAAPAETRVRFTRDWARVRCLDADADVELLEALEGEIAARLKLGTADPKPVLAQIEDSFSNSIQMTEARACLAESMSAELDLLMEMYVAPRREKRARIRTGRAAIAGQMRTQFERAGVWALMRKRIAAATYTQPGDPLRIDCGYRPNGVIKMFHAVSLEGDVEAAKVLAFSAARLREGVTRVEKARLELSAVVEVLRTIAKPGNDEDDANAGALEIAGSAGSSEAADRYRFGVDIMEEQQIRVITVNDLARAAATARADLRL